MTFAALSAAAKVHTYRDCREKELPRDQRPCLNCGKPGHISRDCKQPRAALLDGGQIGSKDAISISTATLRLEFVLQRPLTSKTHAGNEDLRSLTLMDSSL